MEKKEFIEYQDLFHLVFSFDLLAKTENYSCLLQMKSMESS